MPANSIMPKAFGMKHGMATPIAIITEPIATMTLRRCRRSDSGPDTMDVTISTTMEITDMVEIVAAESFTLNPQYFCRIYS